MQPEQEIALQSEHANETNHTIRISFRVTPEEYECIDLKRQFTHEKTVSAYVRRAAVFGKLIVVDKSQFTDMNKSLSGIRGSLNQIAKRLNATERIYDEDLQKISEINQRIDEIARRIIEMKLETGLK